MIRQRYYNNATVLLEHALMLTSLHPCSSASLPTTTSRMNRNAASSMDPAKRNEQALLNLLKIESNKYCADCGQKGNFLKN